MHLSGLSSFPQSAELRSRASRFMRPARSKRAEIYSDMPSCGPSGACCLNRRFGMH
jgi:hypothetical protein